MRYKMPMARQFVLANWQGLDMRVTWSGIFLTLLLLSSLSRGLFPLLYQGAPYGLYLWMGIVATLGLIASVTMHTLAHAWLALKYDLPVSGVTLFPFASLPDLYVEPANPETEWAMAVAGPLISILLAFFWYGLSFISALMSLGEPTGVVLIYLASMNALLALFNMIPAFPLDGGRALRSALWRWNRNLTLSTQAAAKLGVFFSYALLCLGILSLLNANVMGGAWWILIGLSLRTAAKVAEFDLWARHALRGETIARLIDDRSEVTVSAFLGLDRLVSDYFYAHRRHFFPVVDHEKLVGLVTSQSLKKVPQPERRLFTVGYVMQPVNKVLTVKPEMDLASALTLMRSTGRNYLLIADENGGYAGFVMMKSILNVVKLRAEIEEASASVDPWWVEEKQSA